MAAGTSAEWAFYVQVAVPMRLPDAGRLSNTYLPGDCGITSSAARFASLIEVAGAVTPLQFAKHVCWIDMQGAAHRAGNGEQSGEQYGKRNRRKNEWVLCRRLEHDD